MCWQLVRYLDERGGFGRISKGGGCERRRIRLFNSARVREKLGSSGPRVPFVDSIQGMIGCYSGYRFRCVRINCWNWLIDGILYSLYLSILTSLIFLTLISIFVSGKLNLHGGFIIVDKWTGKNIILFSKSSKQYRLWMCYMWNGKKIFESKKTILSLVSLNEFYTEQQHFPNTTTVISS